MHGSSSEITLYSPAKLNWLLYVGLPRDDGYHTLHTVYQSLEIADEITVRLTPDKSDACTLSGFPDDIDPNTNLVRRAWEACRVAFFHQIPSVHISVKKRLPRGGGLGGGSSNAGTVIRALAKLCRLGDLQDPDFVEKLQHVGAQIGSDVPFFINGGTAQGTGRGEVITPMQLSNKFWLVLLMPEVSVSTAEAYRLLDEFPREVLTDQAWAARLDQLQTALSSGDTTRIASLISNDFEQFASRHDWYLTATRSLREAGALRTFLCGSGSTVAGLFSDEAAARQAAVVTGGIATSTA